MKKQFSRKKIAVLCSIAFSLISINDTFAQNAQSTLIVSGSRFEENLNEVPANVQVITREEIAESTSTNIPDILSQIGGLNVRNTQGGQLNLNATIDMGGYGATANSTTLVLVDGQRINPIDSSSISWESIPIDSINRIEILRGGASVQYGNGAVGGVINIITNGGKKDLNINIFILIIYKLGSHRKYFSNYLCAFTSNFHVFFLSSITTTKIYKVYPRS